VIHRKFHNTDLRKDLMAEALAPELWYLDNTGWTTEEDCPNLCQTCRCVNFVHHELPPHKRLSLENLAEIITVAERLSAPFIG
jgi:hypothetical protein